MTFLSPWLLFLLLIGPLLLAAYWWLLRRKRKFAVRYSSLSLIREALPKYSRWRQHLPFALFLLGMLILLTAVSRPVALVEVPLSRTTIILALDVSRSMCSTDVDPNRMSVAQEAALAFIDDQPDGTRMGVVAFADFAELVVVPTTDKEVLTTAVANLTTALGTAIGSATLKSIDAIAEVNTAVAPSGVNLQPDDNELDVLADAYQPDIIVLLTDGANSRGPLPLDAAQQAADRGVRVYTIGFGTDDPQQMVCSRRQLGGSTFGPGAPGFGGFGPNSFGGGNDLRRFLMIDEDTLQAVSDLTGGAYYRAESATQLNEVFRELPTEIVLQQERLEISVIFAALGALLATTAVALSLWWHRYPV